MLRFAFSPGGYTLAFIAAESKDVIDVCLLSVKDGNTRCIYSQREWIGALAWTADGTVMGIRHWREPVEGIQVHPESILTPQGHRLLRNYLSVRARRSQFSNL